MCALVWVLDVHKATWRHIADESREVEETNLESMEMTRVKSSRRTRGRLSSRRRITLEVTLLALPKNMWPWNWTHMILGAPCSRARSAACDRRTVDRIVVAAQATLGKWYCP